MKHSDLRHDHLSIIWQLRSPTASKLWRCGRKCWCADLKKKNVAAGANFCKKKKCVCGGGFAEFYKLCNPDMASHLDGICLDLVFSFSLAGIGSLSEQI